MPKHYENYGGIAEDRIDGFEAAMKPWRRAWKDIKTALAVIVFAAAFFALGMAWEAYIR